VVADIYGAIGIVGDNAKSDVIGTDSGTELGGVEAGVVGICRELMRVEPSIEVGAFGRLDGDRISIDVTNFATLIELTVAMMEAMTRITELPK
jgi:hypothetical protein